MLKLKSANLAVMHYRHLWRSLMAIFGIEFQVRLDLMLEQYLYEQADCATETSQRV
jgi:hypothetical protein